MLPNGRLMLRLQIVAAGSSPAHPIPTGLSPPPTRPLNASDFEEKPELAEGKLSDKEFAAKCPFDFDMADMIIRKAFDPYQRKLRLVGRQYARDFRWVVDVFTPTFSERALHIITYCAEVLKKDEILSADDYAYLYMSVFKSFVGPRVSHHDRVRFWHTAVYNYITLLYTCHTPAQQANFTACVHRVFNYIDRHKWLRDHMKKISDTCTVPGAVAVSSRYNPHGIGMGMALEA